MAGAGRGSSTHGFKKAGFGALQPFRCISKTKNEICNGTVKAISSKVVHMASRESKMRIPEHSILKHEKEGL